MNVHSQNVKLKKSYKVRIKYVIIDNYIFTYLHKIMMTTSR